MGSLEDSEELFPIEYGVPTIAFAYDDPLSYSGVIKAVILDDLELLQELVSQGKSARIVDNHGNTPLHIAAYRATNLELIKYLLSLEEVDINARNHYGHTPLLLSVLKSKETSAYILIKTGADVNIASNEDITPLHHSVRFSTKLSEALILAGAIIDQIDYDKDTALHDTIVFGNMETLCMLLYYGADTSIKIQLVSHLSCKA
ncbi:hypothetical protein HHI36_012566 [Cryptolaemus montrouzieri]|uniref:Ankyrin repeat protein n=1 Tax=Cryptolaemus montrouzieri TaxID=559131 RepID=A0ABD2NET0_9CUCU